MRERAVVGIAQWLAAPGRPRENLETAIGFIEELAGRGCDLVLLPEYWACGFDWTTLAEDAAAAAEPLDGSRCAALATAAGTNGVWLAAGTVPEQLEGGIANTALLFDAAGELRATHRKAHLYAPLGEDRVFVAGDRLTTCATEPFGTVGLSVCFDGDFPEVARAMRRVGARVIAHPSAYELEAATWWDTLYPANALANGQWWLMANQCGTTGAGTILGASRVVAPDGRVVAEAPRATAGETPEPFLLVAELDVVAELARVDRDNAVLWELARPELYGAPGS